MLIGCSSIGLSPKFLDDSAAGCEFESVQYVNYDMCFKATTERLKFAWYGSTEPNQVKLEENEFQEAKPWNTNIYRWAVCGTVMWHFLGAEPPQINIRCFLLPEIDRYLSISFRLKEKCETIFSACLQSWEMIEPWDIRTNPVLYVSTERPKFAWYGSTTPNRVKFGENEFQEVKPRYANIYRWAVRGTMVSGVWCQFLCAEREKPDHSKRHKVFPTVRNR